MANLVNANSNQNYFQYHGSHYKYEKGVPLGLPISRSIFQNFLHNLDAKFIKSNSQSRALTHYPMGCPWRHCTPDLFISSYPHFMDLADPCGNPSWSSQSSTCHHILCDPFHGMHGVQEVQISVMMSHNADLVYRLLSGVLKLGLHGNHGSSKGDVAQPQPIHWLTNDSFRNSRSDGEMRWSTILLKWHLLHNPIVAGLWYNMIPHLIHVTPLKVPSNPSNKYGPMT